MDIQVVFIFITSKKCRTEHFNMNFLCICETVSKEYPWRESAGSQNTYIFNSTRYFHIAFQSDFSDLYSHQ